MEDCLVFMIPTTEEGLKKIREVWMTFLIFFRYGIMLQMTNQDPLYFWPSLRNWAIPEKFQTGG